MRRSILAQWFALVLLVGVITPAAAAPGTITGTASYRERIALPAEAVFEATLEEVSRADAPAVEVARTRIENPGNPPIRFSIAYDSSKIEAGRQYVVRTRIFSGGRLMFTSDSLHRVLNQGSPSEITIMMRMAGQRGEPVTNAPATVGAHGLRLPATFRGDLPCADCAGIRHHLNLWPDQVFMLSRTWLGKDLRHDAMGRWSVDTERQALVLWGVGEMPVQFEILNNQKLRLMDLQGRPIVSDLPYELTSQGTIESIDVHLFLGGMFTYMADAARFSECKTGRSYPVAMEGDYLRLEKAYLEARKGPGAPLMVTFEGSIAQRPRIEGEGTEATAVVKRFINVWPGETCERNRAEASLTNTYWRIVRLGNEEIEVGGGRREPHMLLRSEQPQFSATIGCNQLIGGYEVAGESLRFTHAASTLMACPPPLDVVERRLVAALEIVRSWRISGQVLELRDVEGKSVALLQAVYLR